MRDVSDSSTARISPTAHYTSFVWYRNGLSPTALRTREGWLMYQALRPMNSAYELVGGPSLEQVLLARHQVIDHILSQAIESGAVRQVIEVAAGLSARGYRMVERHRERDLVYIEGDLPGMAARKRRLLAQIGPLSPNHQVVELDALSESSEHSIGAVGSRLLRPDAGTAILTEGLLNYFDRDRVLDMWRRFARFLSGYPQGLYLSDLHTRAQVRSHVGARLFQRALGVVARGAVHVHFDTGPVAEEALLGCGFASARARCPTELSDRLPLPDPLHSRLIHVLEARV